MAELTLTVAGGRRSHDAHVVSVDDDPDAGATASVDLQEGER
jgi:hypothetical protein